MSRRNVGSGTVVAASIVAAAAALPLVYLVIRAAGTEGDELQALASARTAGLLLRTLLLAGLSAGMAIAIGVPLAFHVEHPRTRFRRTLTVLLALPLAIPSYVAAATLISFAGPNGTVAGWVGVWPSIYGLPGAVTAVTMTTYPLVFLGVRAAIRSIDPSLLDAASTLGSGPVERFRRVTWPMIRPAATSGGLLVALYAMHDFGAVALMRYDTFARGVFVAYQASFDRSRAALLGLLLAALAVAVTLFELRARGTSPRARVHAGAARSHAAANVDRRSRGSHALVGVVLGVALGMPLLVLVAGAVRGARAIQFDPTMESLLATLSVAIAAAVACLVAAYPVAHVLARRRGVAVRVIASASIVAYALPGVVVALAVVFLAVRAAPWAYQTIPLLIAVYAGIFLPQATGPLRAAIEQIPTSREDAGRVLGDGRLRVLRRLTLPALRPAGVAAAALVFATSAKELPATMLLSPPGFRTLAMSIYSESAAARFDQAALPAILLLLVSAIPISMLVVRGRISGGQ